MSSSCAVLIAVPELWPRVRSRLDWAGELFTFPETECLAAIEAIGTRRPRLVVIHQHFATTCRGATLIDRIRTDPSLSACEIRVIMDQPAEGHQVHRRADGGGPEIVPLGYYGTRRAARVKVPGGVDVRIDGIRASLVDLSAGGAQVLTEKPLRPDQRISMTMADNEGRMRVVATVAWSTVELGQGTEPRYRAGVAFTDAEPRGIERFCARHAAHD